MDKLTPTLTEFHGTDVGRYCRETKLHFYNQLQTLSSVAITTDRENEFEKYIKKVFEKTMVIP